MIMEKVQLGVKNFQSRCTKKTSSFVAETKATGHLNKPRTDSILLLVTKEKFKLTTQCKRSLFS